MSAGRGRRGLTLVEVLVVTGGFFLLLGALALAMSQTSQKLWVQTGGQISSIVEGQRAMDRLAEDLRGGSVENLVCLSPSSFQVTRQAARDDNGDGQYEISTEVVTYAYDSVASELQRNGTVVANRVTDFSYWLPSGTRATPCPVAGEVLMNVNVRVAPRAMSAEACDRAPEECYVLASRIRMRSS